MIFPDMDIYCHIIDNYGDIGFCKHLEKAYKSRHPEANVRLFVNGEPKAPEKSAPLVVETFGCEIPSKHFEIVKRDAHLWINIEYLTAEKWIENCHGRESPQSDAPNLRKYFFMPGFTDKSGGIFTDFPSTNVNKNIISVFTYNQDFSLLLEALSQNLSTEFLVFDKYSQDIFADMDVKYPQHKFTMSPFVTAEQYDEILATSKLNLVRGEVSFVRAILAGKPFLWQAYIQEDNYHLVKVNAFLDAFEPFWQKKELFALYKQIMIAWNGGNQSISVDNLREFFENLHVIGEYTQNFALYLRKECDLALHFDKFIEKLW